MKQCTSFIGFKLSCELLYIGKCDTDVVEIAIMMLLQMSQSPLYYGRNYSCKL
jgi:hypothetical protein